MAHEILTVKLCEADEQLADLHRRIRASEHLSSDRLQEEIASLRIEVEDRANALESDLTQSKAGISDALFRECECLKSGILKALDEVEQEIQKAGSAELQSEKRILTAEYGIDFAILATKCALLKALEAVAANEEMEEGK